MHFVHLSILPHVGNKGCYEAKPRTSLAWATSALPQSHNNRTTTNPQNPLCLPHRWYWAFRVWEKTLSMGSFLMKRIFQLTPNGVLMAHTEWLPSVWVRHSVPPKLNDFEQKGYREVSRCARVVRSRACYLFTARVHVQWIYTYTENSVTLSHAHPNYLSYVILYVFDAVI